VLAQLKVALHRIKNKRRKDYRTRRNRTERRWQLFEAVMPAMVDEYMAWHAERGDEGWGNIFPREGDGTVDGSIDIKVLDIFCMYSVPKLPAHI
jgi:hypothetical protein